MVPYGSPPTATAGDSPALMNISLRFLLPLALLIPGPPDPPELTLVRKEGVLEVRVDEQLFTVFHHADPEVTKPYLYPLVGPGGVAMTRGYPMNPGEGEARDHPHHTSSWFAHGELNGHDFWWGKETRIVLEGELVTELDGDRATIESRHRWLGTDGEAVCLEERRMVLLVEAERRTLDFDITLRPLENPLVFGDTKEGLFALRLAPWLRLEGEVASGSSRNSEGVKNGECWGKRARWITYWGESKNGAEAGVAIFDHPENHAYPTWWHARDYGLVAANPFGRRAFEGRLARTGGLTVPADGAQRFRYRIVLYRGAADARALEQAWRVWARLPE